MQDPAGARRIAGIVTICLVLAACSPSAGGRPGPTGAPTTRPPAATAGTTGRPGGRPICGLTAKPPATWAHVIWIWMENHDYPQVVGNSQAPYENTLIARCGLATNFHNITHPSLPNYLAATSGAILARSDCGPDTCPTTAPSLFGQLRGAGRRWRAYQESMPTNCQHTDTGDYAARHNPPVYYAPIAGDCTRWDLPMGDASSGHLIQDLRSGALPDFAFITPNLCHDTHDCPVSSGDGWLAAWIPRILRSPAYQAGNTVVLLTWDEGGSGGGSDCARDTRVPGCHVPTIVISPTTPAGARSGALFNHYSLLKTTEQLLGLRTALGHAGDPATRSMRGAFNL